MTTKEKMEALCRGDTLVYLGMNMYMDSEGYIDMDEQCGRSVLDALGTFDWQIKPKPTMRFKTRDEVLGFIVNTPGIVVRLDKEEWVQHYNFNYTHSIERYEWTTISLDGVYGEPRRFEMEVKS